ncbi:4Fe-4S binding protein [Anaerosacchariphilus polymeriproducens]|nr:4Fe-4S binding protein [Anaerosacchariphilus polymeriproducens]
MATLMRFTKTVMKNLFSKPVTTAYPAGPAKVQERTRGQVSIDIDKCVYCTLCAMRCPANAIKVDRNNKIWEIDRFGCIQCANCVNVCAKNALSMDQHYTSPAAKSVIVTYGAPKQESEKEQAENKSEK